MTLFYPSSTFDGVWCGFENDTLTWVSSLANKYPWGSDPETSHAPKSIIEIHQKTEHFSTMVNTRQKHVKCFICIRKLCNENQLEAHYQQYHPISMNQGLFPNLILTPAGWDHREQSWFDYSTCIWMAIDKLSMNDLLIGNIPGALTPKNTPNKQPIDTLQPALTGTPDPTKTKAHAHVVGVEHAGDHVWQTTGLYNKH